MMHVDAPSSTMHRCMVMFWTETSIWKATKEGIIGLALSRSKTITCESKGSIAPNMENRAFCCLGHDCRNSKADMATCDCAKSSTML